MTVPAAAVLIVAGFQVPAIALSDVLGNAGTVAAAQIVSDVPKMNVGVMFGFTVTANVTIVPH